MTSQVSDHLKQPKTHIHRQATRHDCLPSLLGDRNKYSEIVYGEEIFFCTGPTRAALIGPKSLVPAHRAQRTNQGPLLYVLTESPFASVSRAAPLSGCNHEVLCSTFNILYRAKLKNLQRQHPLFFRTKYKSTFSVLTLTS
jgi:hypothetical protein